MKPKIILLFFVLKYSPTFSLTMCDIFNFDCKFFPHLLHITTESSNTQIPDHKFPGCPEGQSLISREDITIMIDHIAKHTTKIEESLVEGYYQKAIDVRNKYIKELNKYQEKIKEQPKHLKHILKQMEDERMNLEPTVKQIAVKIEESDFYEEQKLPELNKRLQHVLTAINAYEAICQINTGNLKLMRRLKPSENSIPINGPVPSTSPICGSIKEIHNEIVKHLTNFRDEYIKELLILVEDKDTNYAVSVASHNKNMIDIAMRQHKDIMYDVLKLQDDFIHFKEHLNEFNITQTLNDTKNILEMTPQLLNALEEDVHEYGRSCVESNNKKNRGDLVPSVLLKAKKKHHKMNLKIVDDLTQLKIEEIKNKVLRNLTDIFKTLDEHLNYSIDSINSNPINYDPNPEDLADVKRAQDALIELKSIIPQSSFDKIQTLRQKSQEILGMSAKARENLNLKLKGNDLLAQNTVDHH